MILSTIFFAGTSRRESFLVNGRIISLVRSDSDNLGDALRLPSRELVQNAGRMLGETCTIGISRTFDKFSKCGGAYFEAITARRYTVDGGGPIRFITDQEHSSATNSRRSKNPSISLNSCSRSEARTSCRPFSRLSSVRTGTGSIIS